MSNDMSSIQILLRNMERQQINTAIDEQYAKLSKEMDFEAKNSVKKKDKKKTKTNGGTDLDHRKNDDDNKHKSKPIVSKKNDPLLQKLVNEGLATVGKSKPITKKKPFKVSGELDYKAYNKLSIDNQLKYDRTMAGAYKEAGKGNYQRPTQKKAPVKNITTVNWGDYDKKMLDAELTAKKNKQSEVIYNIKKPNYKPTSGIRKVFFGNPNPILMDYGTI